MLNTHVIAMAAAVILGVGMGNAARAQCPRPLPLPPLEQWLVVKKEQPKPEESNARFRVRYHQTGEQSGTFDWYAGAVTGGYGTSSQFNPMIMYTREREEWTNSGRWWIEDGCVFKFVFDKGTEGRVEAKKNGNYIGKPN